LLNVLLPIEKLVEFALGLTFAQFQLFFEFVNFVFLLTAADLVVHARVAVLCRRNLVLKAVLLIFEFFEFRLIDQDFGGERLNARELPLNSWTLGISVFDVIDVQVAICCHSEQFSVIEAQTHSCDWT